MRKINVVVVEDDARLRKTVERVIVNADGCRLAGMFANATDAIREIPKLAPDVILMDVNLPDRSGVECVATLAPLLPNTQILMLTVYQDPETTFQAITAGAHGYLVKPVMPKRLVEAIHEVRDGGVPMSRAIARKVIEAFRSMHEERAHTPPPAARPADLSRDPLYESYRFGGEGVIDFGAQPLAMPCDADNAVVSGEVSAYRQAESVSHWLFPLGIFHIVGGFCVNAKHRACVYAALHHM